VNDPGAPLRVETRPSDPVGPSPAAPRVSGLDGLRGLAAVYVVLFHCWLLALPGFPATAGPTWLGWLSYGRIAVVFFLALSGFSLAVGPASNGWQLGSISRFLRRRAWRILPPYWAALAASLAVAFFVIPASHLGPPTGRTVVVYGLVLQDVLTAPTPNGAFWSIAVEVELYLVLPLLILIRRRLGAVVLVAATTVPVVAYGLLSANAILVEGVNWLTPNLLPVFVAGMIGAGVVAAPERVRRLPWQWLAVLAVLPVLAVIARNGVEWTVDRYYWIDLAVAPAMAMLLAAVATGRPMPLLRLLSTWPFRRLGEISYSLYLTHLMVIMIVARKIAPEFLPPGPSRFWFTLLVGLPSSLLGASLFAAVFETPVKRNRSWKAFLPARRSKPI
jgi:peptidoglycan/LPS O-acetylase OafA/YrhL